MKLPPQDVREIDRPELCETFVDSVGLVSFDGQTARIELCVTRYDPPKPPARPSARKYPAVRLVLPPETLAELFTQLRGVIGALEKQGILKTPPPSTN